MEANSQQLIMEGITMKFRLFTLVLDVSLSGFSYAQTTLPAQAITAIETVNNGQDLQFKFDNGVKQEGCSSSNIIVKNGAMSERILSITLSAYHADHGVRFIVSGCTGGAMQGLAVSLKKS